MAKLLLLILVAFPVWLLFAAGPRMASFTHVATNRVEFPISTPMAATCTISVVNASSVPQEFDLTVDAMASGVAGGGASLASSTADPASTITIGAGISHNFTYEYPAFPASTTGTQTVVCKGKIVVKATAQAGHILASGSISTFQEASKMSDQSTGAKKLIGSGMQSQFKSHSFVINQGKPF